MSLPHYTKANHTTSYPSISPTLPVLSTAGKTIFITGGGSGLGPHLGQAFALSGTTKVTIIGRTASSLLSTKASIEDKFPCLKVLTFVADITSPTAVTSAFEATKKEFGPINILVSNAGQMSEPSEIGKADVDTWFQGFETNVKGALILTQAFLANCSEKAVLINITSGGAHIPANPLGFSSYATSKLAAAKMMEYVGVENPNVRVMNIHPGTMNTEMYKIAYEGGLKFPPDNIELSANFIVWATSPEAEFLKGKLLWANWDVDELKARREELEGSPLLTLGLLGWP